MPQARRRLRIPTAIAVVMAAAVLDACGGGGGDHGAPAGVYVGKVTGTDAYIAIVSDGKHIGGYFCDGNDVIGWIGLAALSRDGKAGLQARKDGNAIGSVALAPGSGSGTLVIKGTSHAFAVAPGRGTAGLYRGLKGTTGRAGAVEAGWVVLADGTQRGALDPRAASTLAGPSAAATYSEQLKTTVSHAPIGEIFNNDPQRRTSDRASYDLGTGLPSLPIVKISRPSLVVTPKLKPPG